MSQRLRHQTLLALMEQSGFLRRSFGGLLNEHPDASKLLKELSLDNQDYALMDILQNPEKIDDYFFVFVKDGKPTLIQIKASYDISECTLLSEVTGISLDQIKEAAEATK